MSLRNSTVHPGGVLGAALNNASNNLTSEVLGKIVYCPDGPAGATGALQVFKFVIVTDATAFITTAAPAVGNLVTVTSQNSSYNAELQCSVANLFATSNLNCQVAGLLVVAPTTLLDRFFVGIQGAFPTHLVTSGTFKTGAPLRPSRASATAAVVGVLQTVTSGPTQAEGEDITAAYGYSLTGGVAGAASTTTCRVKMCLTL